MPEWLRKLWDDLRPNLIWATLVALGSSGVITAAFAAIQSSLDQAVTVITIVIVFLVSSVLILAGVLALNKKRVRTIEGKAGNFMNALLIYFPIVLGVAICFWGYVVGKKVFQMSDDVELLQRRMERYVLPRTLTSDQRKIIAEYLSKFDPQPIFMKVAPRNEEASSYRADLQQALEKGGWPVANIAYDETVQEGLHINMTEPMQGPGQPNPFDRLNPRKKPNDILREAFTQAGIVISGTGGGSGRDITATTITISIGNRRRDKWAIPPSAYMKRPHVELPEDLDREGK